MHKRFLTYDKHNPPAGVGADGIMGYDAVIDIDADGNAICTSKHKELAAFLFDEFTKAGRSPNRIPKVLIRRELTYANVPYIIATEAFSIVSDPGFVFTLCFNADFFGTIGRIKVLANGTFEVETG